MLIKNFLIGSENLVFQPFLFFLLPFDPQKLRLNKKFFLSIYAMFLKYNYVRHYKFSTTELILIKFQKIIVASRASQTKRITPLLKLKQVAVFFSDYTKDIQKKIDKQASYP